MEIVLQGLESELEYSVRKQMENINVDIKCINSEFKRQLGRAVKIGLRSLGYYDPKIKIFYNLEKTTNEHVDAVIVKVYPGDAVRIVDVDLVIHGDGKYDIDYQNIVKDSKLFIGKKLKHSDYKKLKNRLYSLAISKGYWDAKFKSSQLIVMPSVYQCIWKINFDSGCRYIFEEIKFQNSQIRNIYLNNISNIHSGEFYDAKSIMELNRRLFSTNWFESVSMSSDFETCLQKKN